jgi:hypothetical protein
LLSYVDRQGKSVRRLKFCFSFLFRGIPTEILELLLPPQIFCETAVTQRTILTDQIVYIVAIFSPVGSIFIHGSALFVEYNEDANLSDGKWEEKAGVVHFPSA